MRRRTRRRTKRLAIAAGAATAALVVAEAAHLLRRREPVAVLRAGYRSGSADETALLNLFLSFGVTFAVARGVTHSIRRGAGPFRNVRIGRRHIHHFVPGIALALGSGGTSIALRSAVVDPWLAVPFGAGAALIIDETALLVELEDVYWHEKGTLSVDVAFGAASLLAILALIVRLIRRGEALVPPPPPEPAS